MITLRPSNAHRWWRCAMSASVAGRPGALPDTSSAAADEGTCAAWLLENVITRNLKSCADMLGERHENGWVVDQDMCVHVQPFVDRLAKRVNVRSEVKRSFSLNDSVMLAGTLDVESWSDRTLRIDDLKYGYGIVEPFENKQLICYAYLKIMAMRGRGEHLPDLIVLGIYQPRAIHPDGPYRRWTVSPEELQPYFRELVAQMQQIESGLAVPGTWCNHCLGAAGCTALTRTVYKMWQSVESREFHAPSNDQLGDELVMLKKMDSMMKARLAAVEAETETRIKNGAMIPGWTVEERRGKRKFSHDAEMIRSLTGIDPTDTKLCTPAELIRRGVDKKIVDSLSHIPTIGSKLTRIDSNHFAKMFKNGEKTHGTS